MAKSRRKKAKKAAELEHRVKQASFTLAAILLARSIESLGKRSLDRTTAEDEPAPALLENPEPATKPLREGVAAVKSVAEDLTPRWSEIFASFKDKIQRAVERIADAPGEFDRSLPLGLIDGAGETLDSPFPETEPKKSPKKTKKPNNFG
ncbi:hypothetical protein V0288_21985 [Pannus brasiliensis CCIBt3594]|uniref:Uncharacterized protein n=1 Tax=Pannus brasiliensis CCIBt3594 TaxID=1427578 RepID=A0AAW9R1K6_9CHRO